MGGGGGRDTVAGRLSHQTRPPQPKHAAGHIPRGHIPRRPGKPSSAPLMTRSLAGELPFLPGGLGYTGGEEGEGLQSPQGAHPSTSLGPCGGAGQGDGSLTSYWGEKLLGRYVGEEV